MLNELSGTIELSVVTTFSIPAPTEFSAMITLKNGTAKCKMSYLSVLTGIAINNGSYEK